MKHERILVDSAAMPLGNSPRRGLSCEEAATYIGIGQSKFLALVELGKMPKPIRIDRRTIWDIRALDAAFDRMREEQEPSAPIDDGWGNATL